MRRNMLAVSGIVVGALLLATAASAEYPERRIQHVYPWTPGTPTYAVSQIIADAMGNELGVQMPVVAKPGAGGVNAFMAALNEPADGYTALDGYVAPLIISPLFDKTEYTFADFVPLYSATSNAFAIATRADEDRFTDFPSFIEYL
jgi:tripartite-type tricarboxylate transporter receptor subunit TctC